MSEAQALEIDTAHEGGTRRELPGAPAAAATWTSLGWLAMTDKLDAVRIYSRLGLHPILIHGLTAPGGCTCGRPECEATGKHPVHKGWQREPLNLSSLCADLERDWRFNIGLRMGEQPSGRVLVTIDVDGDRALLEPLEQEHGAFPETLTAQTARGLHLVYLVPAGRKIKNRVRLAPGVDVRAEGGQIVAPPSAHVSGARYRWVNVREPAELR